MALRLSTDLKNYVINQAIIKSIAGTIGTGGSAVLKIYSGSQPASADSEPTGANGTMLCSIINIGWGGSNGTRGATSGTASHGSDAAGYTGTAAVTGTAGWARLETFGTNAHGSAGTFRIDGDVGTAAGSTFTINSISITANGAVTLLTAPISIT
jgi:FlaG/FlaF family flagellin (archaellin)